ncbi:hypothetical protein A8709_29725 [Paenibacillus pectinilyticus]|uniref:Dipeptidylpeptidase IV N-terminal domain-containing protein n=1 Tax=Paenibacillus pectinilyticus TaxID=512399 RepID=A0A1C0ZVB1_9BACL|nr:hypothetical protein [Paenibacillus pectinilyticus]OCT12035.1 hypothetical protein A8709_29725 [Paenibacillus pectinilyticus]
MRKQKALCVILFGMLVFSGCESNQKIVEVQPTPQIAQTPLPSQLEKQPSLVSTATPTESSKASTQPVKSQVDTQASPTPIDMTNQRTLSQYSLDKIEGVLKDDKNVFDVIESPNKKAVAYMVSKTGTDYDPMTLYIWNVGGSRPRAATGEALPTVGDVFWSPNSDYVFVDVGTYVTRSGSLYSAKTLEVVQTFGYLEHVYFSPNGKYIVYSDGMYDSPIQTIKSEYVDPPEPFDLVLYNMETHQNTVLFKGTKTQDYIAIGWLNDNTISYRLTTYSAENKNLRDQVVKYTYDLSNQLTKVDPTQKSPTTDDQYSHIRLSIYNEKDVFGDVWSPDGQSVAYAKGNKKEGHGSVWMWKVGEDKPAQVFEERMFNQIVWSNNSRYFMFNDGMSSEEDIYFVDTQTGKMESVHCFCIQRKSNVSLPYFSADSHYLLFSGVEKIQSMYKMTETGNSHNVSLLNLDTKEIKVLFHPDDKLDYVPLGWSGERKLVYQKINFQTNEEEIAEYELNE